MEDLKFSSDQIKDFKVVNRWLDGLNDNTIRNYSFAMAEFCSVNNLNPGELLKIARKEQNERVPEEENQISDWFYNYNDYLKTKITNSKGPSKGTRNGKMAGIRAFFHHYQLNTPRIRFNSKDFVDHPNKRKGLIRADIRKMLEGCKTLKLKAIILIQISSGLSASDVVNLTVKDFQEGIIEVYDEKTKTKRNVALLSYYLKGREKTSQEFNTVISDEAVKAVEKYLKIERDDPKPSEPLFTRNRKDNHKMTADGLGVSYRRLNDRLDWDDDRIKGGFRKATSHMMRKFFNTQMVVAGMNHEIKEHMMGHSLHDKTKESYLLENEQEILNVYLKFMDNVIIGPKKPPVNISEFTELKMNYEDIKDENIKLKAELKRIKQEQLTADKVKSVVENEIRNKFGLETPFNYSKSHKIDYSKSHKIDYSKSPLKKRKSNKDDE